MNRVRLAIVETHPIQYKVPWFRRLAQEPGLDVEVLYGMVPDAVQQGDGFGLSFEWDLPLLDGHRYRVLDNVARCPSVTTFRGCDTPSLYRILPGLDQSSGTLRSSAPSAVRFDSVIVNGWVTKTCLQAMLAARRAGIPCIVRGEANDIRKRAWWKRALQRVLVKQYAAALYIGKANRDFYRARGMADDRLFFGPYCVDNARFSTAAAAADRSALRRKWDIPQDAFCFLFCGKLQPKKRPMDILHSLNHLASGPHPRLSASSAVHLLLVGDGELRATCETFARDHNLPVSFAGFLNQSALPGAYAAANCLVLPSDSGETWGLVVNEAMACGVPSIVSDRVGCAADLVQSGETGFVFPCGDVEALTACMRDAAEQAREMGEPCRKRVADYSYDALVRGTREAVEKVVKRGPKG